MTPETFDSIISQYGMLGLIVVVAFLYRKPLLEALGARMENPLLTAMIQQNAHFRRNIEIMEVMVASMPEIKKNLDDIEDHTRTSAALSQRIVEELVRGK